MPTLSEIILFLFRILYPDGRAWKMPIGGVSEKFHQVISDNSAIVYQDNLSVLNTILADNDLFDEEDATNWERALGLITNQDTPLDDRKAAILRKYQHPGTQKARQHYLYIQAQLQSAGFDVYVFENRFPDGMGGFETKTPQEVAISDIFAAKQHGQFQHGQAQHGGTFVEKIVNSIDSRKDLPFNVGDNLRSTFFISSSTLGLNAVIPESRLLEFRQLVLRLKPAHSVCFPFISTTPPVLNNIELEDSSGNVALEDDNLILLEDSVQ